MVFCERWSDLVVCMALCMELIYVKLCQADRVIIIILLLPQQLYPHHCKIAFSLIRARFLSMIWGTEAQRTMISQQRLVSLRKAVAMAPEGPDLAPNAFQYLSAAALAFTVARACILSKQSK